MDPISIIIYLLPLFAFIKVSLDTRKRLSEVSEKRDELLSKLRKLGNEISQVEERNIERIDSNVSEQGIKRLEKLIEDQKQEIEDLKEELKKQNNEGVKSNVSEEDEYDEEWDEDEDTEWIEVETEDGWLEGTESDEDGELEGSPY